MSFNLYLIHFVGFHPPERPGFGQEGRRIRLQANHFALQIPDGFIYHYDVDISPSKCPRSINREVMQTAVKNYARELGNYYPVFDGKKNLYTRRKLPRDSVSLNDNNYNNVLLHFLVRLSLT